ncbi:membrane fusion protein, multidrug efflux system [Methylophilus rhizosphaerae]|uniref:Membrane fusion protein, multidrug efflux system n=1 Tax=Methylophilus rhizosphaerae TaxID=492660 RepID=A0A1G9DTQ6_9PROT|nr:HlyD family secretion protein [Methylophilus rhizosphaerae]SDK67222.1 membrane fusion protein, multidrug efflux system [Methylophilus rhizosphaerae]
MLILEDSKDIHSKILIVAMLTTNLVGCGYFSEGQSETTNDAYITADFTLVSPKVSGIVEQVLVEDNQLVKAGDPLVIIDNRDYQALVDSAYADVGVAKAEMEKLEAEIARQPTLIDQVKANIVSANASITLAESNATRYMNLSADGAGTIQENQQAIAQLSQSQATGIREKANLRTVELQLNILLADREKARANLKKFEAIKEQALLSLSYTVITAPIDGVIGRKSVRPGAYLHVGTSMLAIVPVRKQFVVANFQENQVKNMRLFQKVDIKVDSYPDMHLKGYIDSLAPATDVAFAPIQPDNATGNFTKIVQRIPVKIMLNASDDQLEKLRVGMSVIPSVRTEMGHSNKLLKEGGVKQ